MEATEFGLSMEDASCLSKKDEDRRDFDSFIVFNAFRALFVVIVEGGVVFEVGEGGVEERG